METFVPPIEMVENKDYGKKRERAVNGLRLSDIDPELRDIISYMSRLPYCYTIQSCVGHIIEQDSDSGVVITIEPGPIPPESAIYQLAYLAVAIEDSKPGRKLRDSLAELVQLDETFVQWGSANWFWYDQGQLNSYVFQVQPYRHRESDRFTMDRSEAEKWLEIRSLFFDTIRKKLRLA